MRVLCDTLAVALDDNAFRRASNDEDLNLYARENLLDQRELASEMDIVKVERMEQRRKRRRRGENYLEILGNGHTRPEQNAYPLYGCQFYDSVLRRVVGCSKRGCTAARARYYLARLICIVTHTHTRTWHCVIDLVATSFFARIHRCFPRLAFLAKPIAASNRRDKMSHDRNEKVGARSQLWRSNAPCGFSPGRKLSRRVTRRDETRREETKRSGWKSKRREERHCRLELVRVAGRGSKGNIRSFRRRKGASVVSFLIGVSASPSFGRRCTRNRHKRFRAILIPRQHLSIN